MKQKDIADSASDTRQRILDAAEEIITLKGVRNTSLADISRAVGISKGTLYYYYSSKDNLVYDITDNHINKLTDELLSWIDGLENNVSAKEVLKVVFEKILAAQSRGRSHLYLISDAVISNDIFKERFREKYKEWRMTLENGFRKILKNKTADYETLSHIILALLDGFVIQRMLGVENIPVGAVLDLLIPE